MTDIFDSYKATIKALEKEIQTLEKIIRHKDKMITRLRNGNVSIIEYYDKLMSLMDRTMSITKYYKDKVESYEDIMDADEIVIDTLSDRKNKIAKDRDKVEQDRSEIAEEFDKLNVELEFYKNFTDVREQPTSLKKGIVVPVYDHKEFVMDKNDSYEKFKSSILKSKIDKKILKYRFETNPPLSFRDIAKKVSLSKSTVHDRYNSSIKKYEIFSKSYRTPKKP